MPDDAQAWLQVLDGLDRALEHDVSPGARRALLQMRTRAAFLAGRPQLEAVAPPPENVVPLNHCDSCGKWVTPGHGVRVREEVLCRECAEHVQQDVGR
jgi:hypothetical protein